ncbi:hypothetical protein [Actinomyces oris]|uniref:hypothetical protein n=1 Tax=Actinomyces oris TaxID=544580 RepID=UPI00242FD530|nr:hypothetical protein [Actinomyces oris]
MLLVHIAGHADLGAPSPFEDPDEIGPLRAEELENCMTPHEAARHLFDLSFTRTPSHENTDAAHSPHSGSALRKELKAVSRISAATSTDKTAEVLIIGVKGGNTPTDGLARTLVHALRIASSEAADLAGTSEIIIHDACILPSLAVNRESIELLERRIGAHDGHVLLAMAGGAAAVLAEAAGVAAATHQDEWSLMLVDRVEEGSGSQDLPLIPMSVDADPLRGWLMGLGLPTVLNDIYEQSGHIDTEVKKAADAVRRVMGELDSEPSVEDFAQVLQADVARGDLAAAMTLRSWVVANYKHLRDKHQYRDDSQKLKDSNLKGELGKIIGKLKRKENDHPLEEPESWLADQGDLNDLGKYATHNLESPLMSLTSNNLQERIEEAVGEPPEWLSVPSGDVCLLTAQGRAAHSTPLTSGADTSDRKRRKPVIASLLTSEPSDSVRQACAVHGPLTLSAFIACSSSSLSEGERVLKEVKHGEHPASYSPWTLDEASSKVHDYGESITQPGVSSETISSTMEELSRAAEHWLEERTAQPRAVAVTVLGEKAAAISLLHAAQTFGAKHGVPVFLLSMVNSKDAGTGESKESVQFHQLGLDRDVRQALLEATTYCLNRFDLLSASRLLSLGDPAMEVLSNEATTLADRLIEAVNTNDLDGVSSTVLGAMSAVADLVKIVPSDAQARLTTIVGELLRTPDERHRGPNFKAPVALACASPGFDQGSDYRKTLKQLESESSESLLRLLIRVRNKIPINHGRNTLDVATELSLQNFSDGNRFTYPVLLRRAIATVGSTHGARAGDWGRRFHSLRDQVEALGKTGYGEKP